MQTPNGLTVCVLQQTKKKKRQMRVKAGAEKEAKKEVMVRDVNAATKVRRRRGSATKHPRKKKKKKARMEVEGYARDCACCALGNALDPSVSLPSVVQGFKEETAAGAMARRLAGANACTRASFLGRGGGFRVCYHCLNPHAFNRV